MRLNLSSAQKLLLYCARSTQRKFDESIQREIRDIIKKKIDWEKFIIQAKFLGIASNCYLHLKQFRKEVPPEIQNRLKDIFNKNAARNIKLWTALKEIIHSFNQAHIDVIPLKGLFLSENLYGHIGLRSSTDIDLLVHKKDINRAKEALAEKGYIPLGLPYTEKFTMDFRRHEQFLKKEPSTQLYLVEIHWNFYLTSPREYNMKSVWKNTISKNIDNVCFLSLSPNLTLIQLAINLRLHGYLNLKLLSDLDALITKAKSEITWDYVIKQARVNRQQTALFYALFLAKEFLATEIPQSLLNQIKPGWLQNKLVLWIVNPREILSSEEDKIIKVYWDIVRLITSDYLEDVIKTLKNIAFFYPEDMMARYEISPLVSSSFLFQVFRPFYFMWEASKILFGFMRKKQ